MICKVTQMEMEVKSELRGGVGDVTFQHLFKKDEITARTRLCACHGLLPFRPAAPIRSDASSRA